MFIAIVVNPVARPDLTILALARRNAVSFWLREVLPNRRFRGHKVARCYGSLVPNRVKLAGIRAEGCSEARAISAVLEKMQTTETSVPLVCCSPEQLNGATFADGCKQERNTSTKFNRPVFPDARGGLSPLKSLARAGRRRASQWMGCAKSCGSFSQGGARRRAAVAELTSTLDKPCVNAHRQFASSILP